MIIVYLLDTNVLSELVRPVPNVGVKATIGSMSLSDLFASEVTRYELRFGSCLRRDADTFWTRLQTDVLGRVSWLPVSEPFSQRGAGLAAAVRE